ncbi:MAG: RNA polymerase sigma factor [Thermoanaerobacterales bacterium]|nr:RNA polymerase sigma factor [Thermoanaerobacterales bacterium]
MTPAASDQTLVDAARAGDRAALDALLRRHHDRLWRLCRRLLGDEADARDALQDALIAIARGIRRFDGRSTFTTWSYRVATNACLDELRRRRRRPVPGLVEAADHTRGVAIVQGPASTGDGERRTGPGDPLASRPAGEGDGGIGAVAARVDVDAALARLPAEFRAAVVLRDLCDLGYAEIGEVLGIPPGTVRSRIARGRAQLAALLGNPGDPHDRPTRRP